MILDELVLQNFGTFAGRQILLLTPPASDKPVVLIGGLNGAGKTTVLEAIHLALYGALAQPVGRRSGSYENYLTGLIHHGVAAYDGASVELAFHAYQQGVERRYRIRRSWRSGKAAVRERVDVEVDGRLERALRHSCRAGSLACSSSTASRSRRWRILNAHDRCSGPRSRHC